MLRVVSSCLIIHTRGGIKDMQCSVSMATCAATGNKVHVIVATVLKEHVIITWSARLTSGSVLLSNLLTGSIY